MLIMGGPALAGAVAALLVILAPAGAAAAPASVRRVLTGAAVASDPPDDSVTGGDSTTGDGTIEPDPEDATDGNEPEYGAAITGAGFVDGSDAADAQAAAALPGGRANYVVSLGQLRGGKEDNWVRLLTYAFTTDGKVSANGWNWTQAKPDDGKRVGTGTKPGTDCATESSSTDESVVRRCEVLTAKAFTQAVNDKRTGTWRITTVSDGYVQRPVVNITWNTAQTWSEQWWLVNGTKLSRLDFKYNTFAQYGYGYGSRASLGTRRPMTTVVKFPGTLYQDVHTWSKDAVTANPSGSNPPQSFALPSYRTCSTVTYCLTYLQPSSGACQSSSCPYAPAGLTSIQYYLQGLSSKDRRDTLWHWCTCLTYHSDGTKSFCYTGNSHIKPLLQILDDDAAFHGWVGVEAAFWPNRPPAGHSARYGDMLGTFRLTDFR
jgi:hypothetical protein